MLVLTRKLGEAISIGEDVKIVVMQIKGKQVRLGIKAGPNTAVHREEVLEKIKSENQRASQSNVLDINKIKNKLKFSDDHNEYQAISIKGRKID